MASDTSEVLAPSGAFGLFVLIWYLLLLVVAGLLVWMFVKGASTWFGASRKRDAKTAAAIAVPALIVGGLFIAWFTNGARLAERSFDDILAQSLVARDDYSVTNAPNRLDCTILSASPRNYRPSPGLAEFVVHDAEVLEAEGWQVALFVRSDQESPGWAFEADREDARVRMTTRFEIGTRRTPITERGINYEFYRGCTDSFSLHESSSWEQVAAFDLPPG